MFNTRALEVIELDWVLKSKVKKDSKTLAKSELVLKEFVKEFDKEKYENFWKKPMF